MPKRESRSGDLLGQMVRIDLAGHPYAGRVGEVIDQVPCSAFGGDCECGYDELIVQLENGVRTNVYELEASRVEA
jgi:hypothetical protein